MYSIELYANSAVPRWQTSITDNYDEQLRLSRDHNGSTKDCKEPQRTAQDCEGPRKTVKDLTGPLLFVYFLFDY